MSEHSRVSDLLPLYVSGGLEQAQRQEVEKHLAACGECQADLALWKLAGEEIAAVDRTVHAPFGLAERALAQTRQPHRKSAGGVARLRRAIQLLRSQAPLVQREIWPASAAVIGLGYIVALLAARAGFVFALAPLIAAACVSLIYGPENDPGFELSLSTPTSSRQILLARLALVFGYNLGLVLAATLGLMPVMGQLLLGDLILSWLAPMTFLSAAALALSLWIGAPNAISITYVAWMAQWLIGPAQAPQAGPNLPPLLVEIGHVYQNFWQSPALLMGLSAGLLGAAIWLAGRQGRELRDAL